MLPACRRRAAVARAILGLGWTIQAGVAQAQDTGACVDADTHARLRQRVTALEARIAEIERRPPAAPPVVPALQRPPRVVARGQVVPQAIGLGVPVDVYGEVEGDAVALGADVRVHPGARVRGDAVSLGGTVQIAEGATVTGAPLTLQPQVPAAVPAASERRALGLGLSAGAAAVLAAGLAPRRVTQVATTLREAPGRSLLTGALILLFSLPALLVLGLTVVGLPLAGALLVWICTAGALGLVSSAAAVGGRMSADLRPWVAVLLGGALLWAVGQLPLLGAVVTTLTATAGLGAAARSRLGAPRAQT